MVWSAYFLGFGALVTASVVIRGGMVGSVVSRMYLALLLGSVCSTLLLVFLGGNEGPGNSGSSRGENFPPPRGGSPPRPPDAGRPVPLKPSPKHHLVAANPTFATGGWRARKRLKIDIRPSKVCTKTSF